MAKQMPHSAEAEQAVLGALIVYASTVKEAMDQGLHAEDFYIEHHKRIYDAIYELYSQNKVVDITTLTSKLEDMNLLKFVGGVDYLFLLTEQAVSSANSKYHIQLVQEKAHMRRLILAAEQIASDGFISDNELDQALTEAERVILEVTRNRKTSDFRTSYEVVNAVIENIHRMSEYKTNITGLRTGYIDFDNKTNGLQKGDLIILAARPSVGKTAFALNLGQQCSMINDAPVAIFSLEMPSEQLIARMLSSVSNLESHILRTGRLTTAQWSQLNHGAGLLKDCKLYLDDSSSIKVNDIFSKCRKLKTDHGLSLVIIDYLQLISGRGKGDNRQQEVSEISRSLKQLARELEVPVIALSQLSRSVEQRGGDKTPMLSDLRESGSIEQDADIVIFLSRDDYQTKEAGEVDTVKVDVSFAKHRNGPTGLINLAFSKSISKFYNYEEKSSEA